MHDNTQVVRVQQMAKALSDGQFPVRWVSDLGYGFGYPLYNFYAPLPYYFGGFVNLIGFDVLISTKSMFIFGILLAGISMYFFARNFWGEIGGFLSALLYLYAPYHALDIYVRGAVGEIWAVAFLPLVFYGIYTILQNVNNKEKLNPRQLNIGILGLCGVILSHNITAMLLIFILVILLIAVALIYKDKRLFSPFLLIIIMGLSLSAFFVLPAIFEMKYTNVEKIIGGTADFRNHFVYLDQLWNWPWGFAGSASGRADGMSFKIGKLHLILAFLGVGVLVVKYKSKNWFKDKKQLFSLLAIWLFLFSVFMMVKSSLFIWQALSFLAYMQYPWRFLIFTFFSVSFLGGAVVVYLRNQLNVLITLLLAGAILVLNVKYFQPQKILPVDANYYLDELSIKWKTSKISDEYLPKNFPVPLKEDEIAHNKFNYDNSLSISSQKIKTQELQLDLFAQKPTDIKVNIAYFPGWQVFLDDEDANFKVRNGIIMVKIPSGEHTLKVLFKNTPIRLIANLISLLSLPFLFDKIRRRLLPFIYG